MKKKERFIATYNNKTYEISGKWEGSIVLSPVDTQDDRCQIYTADEMKELLQTGERVLVNSEGYTYYAEKVIMQSNVAKASIFSVV
ncbi:MAG: hypothetical protein PHE70_05890 [Tepidanaerobacteraceae bacterium]|nr:hypothetical protein [Tepidanaerobacteraceae bacterium]